MHNIPGKGTRDAAYPFAFRLVTLKIKMTLSPFAEQYYFNTPETGNVCQISKSENLV